MRLQGPSPNVCATPRSLTRTHIDRIPADTDTKMPSTRLSDRITLEVVTVIQVQQVFKYSTCQTTWRSWSSGWLEGRFHNCLYCIVHHNCTMFISTFHRILFIFLYCQDGINRPSFWAIAQYCGFGFFCCCLFPLSYTEIACQY